MIPDNMENEEQNPEDSVHLFDEPVEEEGEDNDLNNFQVKKTKRTSTVWANMTINMINGLPQGADCKHCNKHFTYSKGGHTTHLKRHIGKCIQGKKNLKNQKRINLLGKPSRSKVIKS